MLLPIQNRRWEYFTVLLGTFWFPKQQACPPRGQRARRIESNRVKKKTHQKRLIGQDIYLIVLQSTPNLTVLKSMITFIPIRNLSKR